MPYGFYSFNAHELLPPTTPAAVNISSLNESPLSPFQLLKRTLGSAPHARMIGRKTGSRKAKEDAMQTMVCIKSGWFFWVVQRFPIFIISLSFLIFSYLSLKKANVNGENLMHLNHFPCTLLPLALLCRQQKDPAMAVALYESMQAAGASNHGVG